MWHWMARDNEKALQKLTDKFNSSQSDVKVSLVNQIDWEATLQKYKSGLGTGDLPDVVQLQETDQQQMIDTRHGAAGERVRQGRQVQLLRLPAARDLATTRSRARSTRCRSTRQGPVLYYNKKAFSAAGLDPESPPKTLDDVRAAAEKLKANGVSAPLGYKTDPIFFEQWTAMANKLFVNNGNGRSSRATKAVFDTSTGRTIFSWLDGMVKDGLAETNADLGTGQFDDLLGMRSGSHAMAIDTSAALGTVTSDPRRRQRSEHRTGRRAHARAPPRGRQVAACSTRAASCSW